MSTGAGGGFLRHGAAARFDIATETLQVGAELGGCLAPQVRILLEGFGENVFEREGQAGIYLFRRWRRGMQNPIENYRRGGAGERNLPSSHLVQHHAK